MSLVYLRQPCRVNLVTAKVATYGERAEDIFFINTHDAKPVTDAQQQCLGAEIIRRLKPVPVKPEVRAIEF
jgi:[protein-PII] uridylyltransferase